VAARLPLPATNEQAASVLFFNPRLRLFPLLKLAAKERKELLLGASGSASNANANKLKLKPHRLLRAMR